MPNKNVNSFVDAMSTHYTEKAQEHDQNRKNLMSKWMEDPENKGWVYPSDLTLPLLLGYT